MALFSLESIVESMAGKTCHCLEVQKVACLPMPAKYVQQVESVFSCDASRSAVVNPLATFPVEAWDLKMQLEGGHVGFLHMPAFGPIAVDWSGSSQEKEEE
ncbi:hypothetical protein ACROYT_G022536 [Oculina patagonica]